MTLQEEIVAVARRYLHVPFVHQGRSIAGLDCLGLLLITAKECGLPFVESIDVPTYSMRPDTVLLQQKLMHFLEPVTPCDIRPGDVLLLRVQHAPQHLAIVTDYPAVNALGMIHAYAPARAVVAHRYDEEWQALTHAAYRLPVLH